MRLFVTIVLGVFVMFGHAQVKLNGIVKDSVGKPIEAANIIAVNQSTKAIESFNRTDANGQYRLTLLKHTAYELTVNYMGMKTVKVNISATQEPAITRDFTLMQDYKSLEEVKITYKIPIKINGDTITYDAESFRNQSDRKLEDVLKRLPGVEVTDDGEIKVEGKIVRDIKVEGRKFFDGSTRLASKNIPSGVLDKIQVLKNADEISQLSSVRDNSENVSINIKLKQGKKDFWFGDIAASGGPRSRYQFHPKIFYYSPKKSANIILDFNNVGDAPLSSAELSRFSVSQTDLHLKSGTNFNVEVANASLAMRNNMARSTKNRFAAANINYSPVPLWDLTGYAIYSGSTVRTQEKSLRQFTQVGGDGSMPVNEATTAQNNQRNDIGLFKLNSIYAPNANNRLDYTAFGNVGKRQLYNDFFSSAITSINQNASESPYKISQVLNYYYTLEEKNIFSFESQYLSQSQDPFYNALLDRPDLFPLAANLGLDQEQSNLNINQQKQVNTNKFDATLNYWNVINRISNINFTLGILASTQRFNSAIYQLLDNGMRYDPQDSQAKTTNAIRYDVNDFYAGLRYRLKAGIFTFEPATSLHTYEMRNRQHGEITNRQFYRLLPSLNIKAQLRSAEVIRFDYRMTSRFTDVNNLAEGLVMNSYNNLFVGNRDLENALSHDFRLSYNTSYNQISRYRYTTLVTAINYNKTVDAIRNQIDPKGVLQVGSPFNSNFADESASASLGMNKALWRLVAGFNTSYSMSRYGQIVAGAFSRNLSLNQNYRVNLRTNLGSKLPVVSGGYSLNINNYKLGTARPKFYTDRIFGEATGSFLKGFKLTASYDYNIYRTRTENLNTYSFLNADLIYLKPNSKWEYQVRGLNILNTSALNQDSANEFYSIRSQYYVQPRYFLLSLKYSL